MEKSTQALLFGLMYGLVTAAGLTTLWGETGTLLAVGGALGIAVVGLLHSLHDERRSSQGFL